MLFAEAQKLLVGGVNSPVRAFKAVGGEPLIIERAEGAHFTMWTAADTWTTSGRGGR